MPPRWGGRARVRERGEERERERRERGGREGGREGENGKMCVRESEGVSVL